jgi:hypothetical protein
VRLCGGVAARIEAVSRAGDLADEHHVIDMDDGWAAAIAEDGFEFV